MNLWGVKWQLNQHIPLLPTLIIHWGWFRELNCSPLPQVPILALGFKLNSSSILLDPSCRLHSCPALSTVTQCGDGGDCTHLGQHMLGSPLQNGVHCIADLGVPCWGVSERLPGFYIWSTRGDLCPVKITTVTRGIRQSSPSLIMTVAALPWQQLRHQPL